MPKRTTHCTATIVLHLENLYQREECQVNFARRAHIHQRVYEPGIWCVVICDNAALFLTRLCSVHLHAGIAQVRTDFKQIADSLCAYLECCNTQSALNVAHKDKQSEIACLQKCVHCGLDVSRYGRTAVRARVWRMAGRSSSHPHCEEWQQRCCQECASKSAPAKESC